LLNNPKLSIHNVFLPNWGYHTIYSHVPAPARRLWLCSYQSHHIGQTHLSNEDMPDQMLLSLNFLPQRILPKRLKGKQGSFGEAFVDFEENMSDEGRA
jgi:hypothetical protein